MPLGTWCTRWHALPVWCCSPPQRPRLSDAVTSRHVKRRGLLAGACFALLIAGAAGSAYAADYTPVTDARLANPEPGNWLMTRGGYKGWSNRRAEHFGDDDR